MNFFRYWRLNFIFLILIVIGAALISRLFSIQIKNHGFYAALANGQQRFSQDLLPKRGEIFIQDKNGNPQVLVQNKNWELIYAVPSELVNPRDVALALAELLGLENEEIFSKLSAAESSYKILAKRVDLDVAAKIKKLGLKGIYASDDTDRYYSLGNFASHLIGFLGYREDKKIGQYGVEGYYNEELSGSLGKFFGERDAFGSVTRFLKQNSSVNDGSDLILTIDPNIQYQAEKILKEYFDKLKAREGTIIVSDPQSGKIRALANFPDFNPNQYQEEKLEVFMNSALQKVFEPGSIVKPLTMAAAIDAGKISSKTTYIDEGEIKIGGYAIKNFDQKAYGERTMTQVLEKSLNTGAVFAENQLGHDLFIRYFKNFGFASKTGLDLEGEVAGNIKNLYMPYEINFATASFGQGIALTPIELVTAFTAIANQGKMMKPYIVEKIVKNDGEILETKSQILGEPISQKTANEVTAMMISVVENGFEKKVRVPGYFAAAKTGTAQVPSASGGYSDETIHSFIGFAPAFDPKFLIFIKLDNPQGIRFAADSIAPAFAELAKYILNYYEIPPER